MTDLQIEKILTILKNTELSLYRISKDTGLSYSTLRNYINGDTKPTKANISTLKAYFERKSVENSNKNSQINGNVVVGNDNNGNIDNRQYYSDSPDVLRAHIDLLEERIKEKDAQIKEKDAQINSLLAIVTNLSKQE